MERVDVAADREGLGWRLSILGIHVDDRLTPEGIVGVMQPFLLIEPSDDMTEREEARERQAFTAACGRDGLTGDRLLLLRIERPVDGSPGTVEVGHLAVGHTFEVPETQRAGIDQIAKLVSVPVIYKFRHYPELAYRGVLAEGLDAVPDIDGDGPELWISRYGRSQRPKSHINALTPVSRNLVGGTSPRDVFVLDLTRFKLPVSDNCVFCTKPLAGHKVNREHVVPDWLRSLVAEHLGVPINGVVAPAHESCNQQYGPGEELIKEFTARRLAGDELSNDELGAVAYWMSGRMVLVDRAAGIESPKRPPLDSSFKSTNVVLAPVYSGRLGDDNTYPSFRTLVMGPWALHLCWSKDGCADADTGWA